MLNRLLSLVSCLGLVLSLSGCSYFGTQDGYEADDAPRWGIQGMAVYEMVGVSPSSADVGGAIDVYLASDEGAPVGSFEATDFWVCTFDGETAMIETDATDYASQVDEDELIEISEEIEVALDELEGSTISRITFTIPEGTQTGEGFVISPVEPNDYEYFHLSIQ